MPTKTYTIRGIDAALWRLFRARCIALDVTVKDRLVELITVDAKAPKRRKR